MTSVAQLVFRDMIENHHDLTSYSWRRLAPSMATLMNLSQTELLALGDWQDKTPVRASMPLHYASCRKCRAQATESNLVADRTIVCSSQFASQHMQPGFKFKWGLAVRRKRVGARVRRPQVLSPLRRHLPCQTLLARRWWRQTSRQRPSLPRLQHWSLRQTKWFTLAHRSR